MAKDLIERATMKAIGNSIRSKKGVTTKFKPSEMPGAIDSIQTGYPEPTGTINITQNGTQNVKDYASANVNVPNSYAAGDEGKVVSNGALVAQTARAEQITANGTYDTTENDSVTVNVAGGGGDDPFALTTYIESSGTPWIDTGYTVKITSRFELVANINGNNYSYATPFGVRTGSGGGASLQACLLFAKYSGYSNLNYNWGTNDTAAFSDAWFLDKKSEYILRKGQVIVTSEDYEKAAIPFNAGTATDSYSMALFVLREGLSVNTSTYCSMKLYRFRIYEGDTLVHEFVPWKDDNDIVCLKDTVTGDLKYNAGTGAFVYGTDS